MPQTFYTEAEFQTLERQYEHALEQLKAVQALRPHWAKGYSSDSVAAQTTTAALSQIWQALGVKNQTECMTQIEYYKAIASKP